MKLYKFATCAGAHVTQTDFFSQSGVTDLLDYGLQGSVSFAVRFGGAPDAPSVLSLRFALTACSDGFSP
jgi:hypothetical protein